MIEINKITKSFGNQQIISNFSLNILEGERIYIVGENGSGKTTLLNIILGFIKADSGQVKLDANLEKIGVIYQGIERDKYFNVQEDLYLEGILHDIDLDIIDNSKFFNKKNYKKKIVNLSGGEWQKLQILKALSCKPDILVTDEITTGLDYESRSTLYKMLNDSFTDRQLTYLSVSHYEEEINLFATKVLFLKDGVVTIYDNKNKDFLFERMIND